MVMHLEELDEFLDIIAWKVLRFMQYFPRRSGEMSFSRLDFPVLLFCVRKLRWSFMVNKRWAKVRILQASADLCDRQKKKMLLLQCDDRFKRHIRFFGLTVYDVLTDAYTIFMAHSVYPRRHWILMIASRIACVVRQRISWSTILIV